jgi:hypothetical protein
MWCRIACQFCKASKATDPVAFDVSVVGYLCGVAHRLDLIVRFQDLSILFRDHT